MLPDGVYMLDPGVSQISPFNWARARFYHFRTGRIEDLGFETEKPIDHYGICLSRDGKWLYYVQADRSGSNLMCGELPVNTFSCVGPRTVGDRPAEARFGTQHAKAKRRFR